jgi:xylulokinase
LPLTDSDLLLGFDIGTASCKLTILNLSGRLVRSLSAPYPTHYFGSQRVEQDPTWWWKIARQLFSQCRSELGCVASVAFSGHMESIVPVSKEGTPLRDCIVWSDQRSLAECQYVRERVGERTVHRITGCRIDPMHSGPKILWLKNHEIKVFEKTGKILSPKDYLNYLITGEFATDYSTASSSVLFDLKRKTWSDELLSEFKIPIDKMPRLHVSTEIIGEVSPQAARTTGLRAGTPVVAGGGDTPCAALGSGVYESGKGILYLGSSASLYSVIDLPKIDDDMRLITRSHVINGLWTIGGGMTTAGSCLTWLRDVLLYTKGLRIEKKKEEEEAEKSLDKLLLEVSKTKHDSDELFFIPNMLGERNPHYRLDSRGAFVGLTLSHDRSSITRAILEGVAMQLRSIYDAIVETGARSSSLHAIGGGTSHPIWNQILSDVLGRELIISETHSPEAIGAALLSGIGTGYISNLRKFTNELISQWLVRPSKKAHITYDQHYVKYLSLSARL